MNCTLIKQLNEALDLNLEANALLQDEELRELAVKVQGEQEKVRARVRKLEDLEDALQEELFARSVKARGELAAQANVLEMAHQEACQILRHPKTA